MSFSFSLSAISRVSGRLGLLTDNSTGVGAPRFMIRLTMSLGSKETWTPASRSGSLFRKRSFNDSRDTAPGLSWTCMTLSSGPPVQR